MKPETPSKKFPLRPLVAAAVIGLVVIGALPINISLFKTIWTSATTEKLSLSQDEAAVISPIMTVYEGGYTGYRCQAAPWVSCYGPVQNFVDATVLRALPESWLESPKLSRGPGHPWPWTLEYPRMANVLLGLRGLAAAGVLLLLTWIALAPRKWLDGWSIAFALALALLAGTSQSFLSAWQGMKNDHITAFWLLALFWLIERITQTGATDKRFRLIRFFAIGGVFLGMIKPTLLAFSLFAGLGLLALELARKTPLKRLAGELVGLLLVTSATYLALNPNTWASTFEAKWLIRLFSHFTNPARVFTSKEIHEELRLAAAAAVPALIYVGIALWNRRKNPGPAFTSGAIPIALGVGVLLYFNFKNCYNRPHYHLPLLLAGFFLLTRLPSASRSIPVLVSALVLGLWALDPVVSWSPSVLAERWGRTFEPIPSHGPDLLQGAGNTAKLIELNTRVPVPLERNDVLYYDSMTETPAHVLARLTTPLHQSREASATMVLPCWSSAESETPPETSPKMSRKTFEALRNEFHLPIVESWAPLSRKFCERFTQNGVSSHPLKAFNEAWSLPTYVVIPIDQFRRAVTQLRLPAPVWPGVAPHDDARRLEASIHPRHLRGALQGATFWGAYDKKPIYFTRSARLSQEFRFPSGQRPGHYRLSFHSSCKSGGAVRARLHSQEWQARDANTLSQFCSYYSSKLRVDVCRGAVPDVLTRWLKGWSVHWFELEAMELKAGELRSAHTGVDLLEIEMDLPETENCFIVLDPIHLSEAAR